MIVCVQSSIIICVMKVYNDDKRMSNGNYIMAIVVSFLLATNAHATSHAYADNGFAKKKNNNNNANIYK